MNPGDIDPVLAISTAAPAPAPAPAPQFFAHPAKRPPSSTNNLLQHMRDMRASAEANDAEGVADALEKILLACGVCCTNHGAAALATAFGNRCACQPLLLPAPPSQMRPAHS